MIDLKMRYLPQRKLVSIRVYNRQYLRLHFDLDYCRTHPPSVVDNYSTRAQYSKRIC